MELGKTMPSISDPPFFDAARLLLDDLIMLSRHDPNLIDELYYNRLDEFRVFASYMENAPKAATNVLIVGEAGVGKSCFIHRLLKSDTLPTHKLFPIVVDYAESVPRTPAGCLLSFVHKAKSYFVAIGNPIKDLKDEENPENNDRNIRAILRHLHAQKTAASQHLVIFLDDFDYLDDSWFELLRYFLPFATSTSASLVLSVRPPLKYAIEHYDDRYRHFFVRNVRRIELGPLQVANILATRLAPILAQNDRSPFFRYIDRLFRRESPMCTVMRKLGVETLEDLPRIEYPFTEKHNAFMLRITSGNIREIFNIAYDSLKYACTHFDTLETRDEGGIPRKIIGRDGVLQLFCGNPEASYEIIDIHRHRAERSRASLWLNVIEAVKLIGEAGPQFYRLLSQLGHRRADVDWALRSLSDKSMRFIHRTRILPDGAGGAQERYPEFEITEKADFYLQMATEWEEYQNRFGEPGPMLSAGVT